MTTTLVIRNIGAVGGGLRQRGRGHDEQRLSARLGRVAAVLDPDSHFAGVNNFGEVAVDVGDGIRFVQTFVLLEVGRAQAI